MAALAAYPEFSCTGGPFEVQTRFGIFKDIYCPGKEGTFTFLQNILDEVVDLFPGQYIHIGGDEAPKTRWKKCPDCQRRILDEGLKDEHALQIYFTNRIANYLAAHGRKIIGWNDALSDDLHPDAIIQYWLKNRKGIIDALQGGRSTIISSYLDYYLDHSYNLTPLQRIYDFEPVFPELKLSGSENILGVEAPLWTESVPDRARLDYQVFPRLLAVAETGWTAENKKDFIDFRARLADFEVRLDALGIRYARGKDVQPPWFRRLFGLLTIAQPQRETAGRVPSR
jgi:hexosaminidase